jgi:hypothetical protein
MMQVTDRTNHCYPLRLGTTIIIAILLSVFLTPDGSSAASSLKSQQKTFASPEEGVTAMIAAMQANDVKALSAIFGPVGMQLISFGDAEADQTVREAFLANYQGKNQLEKVGDAKAILHIGNNDWPFPVPLVQKGQAWYFDSKAGKEEVLDRRIGRHELSAVQVCLAYVDAQKEYALGDYDRDGFFEYAQKFVSDPGKKNGLYWETQEGEKPSPLGPAVARATKEGYKKMPKDLLSIGPPLPYHGYYYKILKSQGKNTPGGAYDYIANGKMIGGFALVAYPAEYGHSGIMTFIVHMDGIVYQKNLGKNSTKAAEALKLFDPDKTWKMVEYGHAVK